MKKFKRILSLLMAFAMVLSLGFNGGNAANAKTQGITVERLDPSDVTANLAQGSELEMNTIENQYKDSDIVRVMIVLEEAPAISLMNSGNAGDSLIVEHRENLLDMQRSMAKSIAGALGEKTLDVQWNLTLVTNAISANIKYGQLDEIANMEGVKDVYVEVRYMPLKADTTNIISQQMTGASTVQNSGYTGAGSRIAVIDTGTDTDHQSFSGAAFEYALAELAEKNGMTFEQYVETLNLLTVEEVAAVLDQLHVADRHNGTLTAEDLYINSKLPFNYNYVDLNLNMDHEDTGNEHGSHVAGIATANRYIDCTKVYDFDGNGKFDMDDITAAMSFMQGGEDIKNVDYADLSTNGTISTYDLHLMLDALEGYQKNGAHYISAYDSVRVTGTAPDAQLLSMKVFGESGGAYASDYMAAVEDAIVLGCDVVNLSLGAPYPGFNASYGSEWSDFINRIMDRVADSGIVMSVAAGNSGNWATYSENGAGMMYTDEAGTYTTSEPATYENALSVASADNLTSITALQVAFKGANGEKIAVSPYGAVIDENYNLSSWSVLDQIDPNYASTDYELVFLGNPRNLFNGLPQTDERIYGGSADAFKGYDFTGKVVLIARGTYTFTEKHANAVLAGAAAVVIYNNVPGAIQPNINDTIYPEVPCAGISLEEAYALFTAFEGNQDGLRAGTLSVTRSLNSDIKENAVLTMSSFSSWGTTGDLRIKPEITAPGGQIYSINGDGTTGDQYELMSGTSMAAPHLSGLTALLTQYFRENDILAKTGLTSRVLAQSLLMSTAEPMIEASTGVEYSIRNQGAGLANIQNAINSHAYITVAGQNDGKVKAELGEGTKDRVVEFTITNFGDRDLTYELDASVLTTGTYEDPYYGWTYSTDGMTKLDAKVTFSADKVTVKAGESVSVKATISISSATVAAMKELGYVNGFYIEGFLYINPVADREGMIDAAHSIPMLGWYGNWSDPSMYDSGTFLDFAYGTLERYSHIMYPTKNILAWCPIGYGQGLYYTGNIYGGYDTETGEVYGDQRYLEERNALCTLPTAQWEIYAIFPTLIRNAGDFKMTITDSKTGELYYVDDYEQYDDNINGSFYYTNYGEWYDSTADFGIDLGGWEFTDMNGEPLAEGTRFDINLICVPELYVENGKVDWDNMELGKGTTLTYSFTIDNTVPELVGDSLAYNAETRELTFTVKDNNYVAAVVLLNGSASAALDYYYPDMDEKGTAVTGSLNLSQYEGTKVAIAVCDYAGNESYYAINLGGEGASYGELIGYQPDPDGYPGSWVAFDTDVNKNETGLFTGTADFICAEYVNGHIFAQDEAGKLYGIKYEDMLADSVNLDACYITTLEHVYQDLAYNYVDGKLYGLFSGEDEWGLITEVYTISMAAGYNDYGEEVPAYTEDEYPIISYPDLMALTMAINDEGTIYILGTPLDWETGEQKETAYLYEAVGQNMWGSLYYSMNELGDTGLKMDYLQSMTWDHNTETLYWARFYPVSWFNLASELVKFTFREDGTFATTVVGALSGETCALMAPLTAATAAKPEHQNVPDFDSSVPGTPCLRVNKASMGVGKTMELVCTFDPWYSDYTDVVWSTSNSEVATVDQNGVVTAHKNGVCEITVTNVKNPALSDICTITVATLTLEIEGIISYTTGGINSVGQSKLYSYHLKEGIPSLTFGNRITAPEEYLGYGLSIGTAIYAKGSIWACEFGNAGIIYEIDPTNGIVKDLLGPIDGDMIFGFNYSEATGMFTGIMNYYLYVDQPLTHEAEEDMLNSYDPEQYQYTWHKFDLSGYLAESAGNFVTGETGNGSVGEIVFCGITNIDNTDGTEYRLSSDFLGGWSMDATYVPTTTHVILDNVGRLWYIDEITNMYLMEDYYYVNRIPTAEELENWIYPEMMISRESKGVFSVADEAADGTVTYNVFVIRAIEETTLTEMFLAGTLPRITYHFSDIYYAGKTAEGAPVYYLSLYDYWNEGNENLLYLYVGAVDTGEKDWNTWPPKPITSIPMLFELGGTGVGNIIASITYATPADQIIGLPAVEFPEPSYGGWSVTADTGAFVGFFRNEASAMVPEVVAPSTSLDRNNIVACVNRLAD